MRNPKGGSPVRVIASAAITNSTGDRGWNKERAFGARYHLLGTKASGWSQPSGTARRAPEA